MFHMFLRDKTLFNLEAIMEFWAKAITCATFLLNKRPTKIVFGRIPKETWSDHKIKVSFLGVFGCTEYSYIPKRAKKQVDDKKWELYFCWW